MLKRSLSLSYPAGGIISIQPDPGDLAQVLRSFTACPSFREHQDKFGM